MKIIAIMVGLLCGLLPYLSFADQVANKIQRDVITSSIDRAADASIPRIEINAVSGSGKASLRFGKSESSREGDNGIFSTWVLTAGAPFNETSDKTEIATLDGLNDAFTLSLKYTRFTAVGIRNPASSVESKKSLKKLCVELKQKYIEKTGESEQKANALVCDAGNIEEYLPSKLADFENLFWDPNEKMRFWGVEGTAGYEDFTYRDSTTFEKSTDNKTPWSIKIFGGFKKHDWPVLFTFGAEYQKGYKGAPSQTICPGGTGPMVCQTGAFAAPSQDDRELIFIESRFKVAKAGVSVKITRDLENDVTGIDIPVSIVPDTKGNLTGGIRAGWRDDSNDLELGIFIGSQFKFFE